MPSTHPLSSHPRLQQRHLQRNFLLSSALCLLMSVASVLGVNPPAAPPGQGAGGSVPCKVLGTEPEGVLSGVVRDVQGDSLPGASVVADCLDFSRQIISDSKGEFRIIVHPGTYRLRVELDGFGSSVHTVRVEPAGTTDLAVTLSMPRHTESVTVIEPLIPAAPENSTTATKTNAPLLETPQAITVITSELIESTGANGLQDALNYAAGVRSDAFGLDSRTDSVLIRGAYPDEYLDGMRQHFNYYTSTTRTDPFLLERVEVLRGPGSMLYGQGSTAGVVNLVTKRPLSSVSREIGLQAGSFGQMQVQADLTGPLTPDDRWLYRLIALGRKSDTQVEFVPDDRALVAPSLSWRPTDATSLDFQFRWQQDESGSTLQFFPWSGHLGSNQNGRIPTERFIGEPGFDRYDSERLTCGWLFAHLINDRWALRQNFRVARNEVDYQTLYADAFSSPGDSFLGSEQRMIGRYAWLSNQDVKIMTADQHVEGRIVTGAVEHHVLVGLDLIRFTQSGQSAFDFPEHLGGGVPAIDAYSPVYNGYTPPPLADDPRSTQRQEGVYLQNQMKFRERWIAVAGARYDRTRNGLEGSDTEHSSATTKRVGLMYAAAGGWSPYLSYSESFTPLAGTDFFGTRYEPRLVDVFEAGIKFQPAGRGYMVAAALFDLQEKNRLISSDPTKPLVQAGSTSTRGAELEFAGRIGSAFNLSAHYNYLDNDEQLDGVPAHQSAIWARRGFASGFTAGMGVRYFSSFTDGTAPTVPELTLVDALIAWESARWRYALNVSNLADDVYVSTCLPRGDCFYGGRRTVSLTSGFRY